MNKSSLSIVVTSNGLSTGTVTALILMPLLALLCNCLGRMREAWMWVQPLPVRSQAV